MNASIRRIGRRHGEWTPTQATDMEGNEMERFEILARIDEVRWLLSMTTNSEDRERLEARIAELEKLLK